MAPTREQRVWKLSEGSDSAAACDEGLSYEPTIWHESPTGYGFVVWFGMFAEERKVHILNPVTCEDVAVLDAEEPSAMAVADKLRRHNYAVPTSLVCALFAVLGWRVI